MKKEKLPKAEKLKVFLLEFKEFAVKGNVLDLAVGVIIGGAFGKITSSLVADIIMPLIGLLIGGFNFATWVITLPNFWGAEVASTVNIGIFIQSLVDFLIIAFCVFLFIRLASKLQVKKVETTAKDEADAKTSEGAKASAEAMPTEEVLLLREIRDLLQKKE